MHFSLSFITHRKSFRSYLEVAALAFFLLIMISGCAVERNVKDNRLFSSYPKVIIDVDKEFMLLGSDTYELKQQYATRDNNFYLFGSKKINEQTIQKGILIQILVTTSMHSPRVQFYTKIDDKAKNVFDHNVKPFGENKYEYYMKCDSKVSSNNIDEWLNKKGYLYPRCTLQQHIMQSGAQGLYNEVTYFEDATLSGLACDNWFDKNKLTEDQKKYLAKFTERADKAIQLIEF
jgi:hypothetical protein